MEFGEGVDHIKPVHINYSGVYNQLRAGCAVKAQHVCDFPVNKKTEMTERFFVCGTRFSIKLTGKKRAPCVLKPSSIFVISLNSSDCDVVRSESSVRFQLNTQATYLRSFITNIFRPAANNRVCRLMRQNNS